MGKVDRVRVIRQLFPASSARNSKATPRLGGSGVDKVGGGAYIRNVTITNGRRTPLERAVLVQSMALLFRQGAFLCFSHV